MPTKAQYEAAADDIRAEADAIKTQDQALLSSGWDRAVIGGTVSRAVADFISAAADGVNNTVFDLHYAADQLEWRAAQCAAYDAEWAQYDIDKAAYDARERQRSNTPAGETPPPQLENPDKPTPDFDWIDRTP